jgi:hypothetical protein
MKQKNKITEIKKSNALINAFYNISVDTYKIFSLAASKFKDQLYFQKDITQDQEFFDFCYFIFLLHCFIFVL